MKAGKFYSSTAMVETKRGVKSVCIFGIQTVIDGIFKKKAKTTHETRASSL